MSETSNHLLGLEGVDQCLRSVVHHPFGLPLTWFLNKRFLESSNDDVGYDDDGNDDDRKPSPSEILPIHSSAARAADHDGPCSARGGAAEDNNINMNEPSSKRAVHTKTTPAEDIPCLLTASSSSSSSSSSDSDVLLLGGVEAAAAATTSDEDDKETREMDDIGIDGFRRKAEEDY